ncbi:hypothetical protein [Paenibacillus lycopersici]|nr:hypothetical protein [Paenibacillus lycopersici]
MLKFMQTMIDQQDNIVKGTEGLNGLARVTVLRIERRFSNR